MTWISWIPMDYQHFDQLVSQPNLQSWYLCSSMKPVTMQGFWALETVVRTHPPLIYFFGQILMRHHTVILITYYDVLWFCFFYPPCWEWWSFKRDLWHHMASVAFHRQELCHQRPDADDHPHGLQHERRRAGWGWWSGEATDMVAAPMAKLMSFRDNMD